MRCAAHNTRFFLLFPAGGDGPPLAARLNSNPTKNVQR
jgi:hypothetical protein